MVILKLSYKKLVAKASGGRGVDWALIFLVLLFKLWLTDNAVTFGKTVLVETKKYFNATLLG